MSAANKQKRTFKAQALNMNKAIKQIPKIWNPPNSDPIALVKSDYDTLEANKACSLIREFCEIEAAELKGQMPDSIIEKLEFTLVIQHGTQKHVEHHIKPLAGQSMPMQIKSPKNDPNNPACVCVYLTKKQLLKLQHHWKQGEICQGLL